MVVVPEMDPEDGPSLLEEPVLANLASLEVAAEATDVALVVEALALLRHNRHLEMSLLRLLW